MDDSPPSRRLRPERERDDHEPSPYKGLGFYTEADAKYFFGRSTERKLIITNLRTSRLTVLYAESGVGKSSLLRAGVVARLHELAAQRIQQRGSARFVPVIFSEWQDDPLEPLVVEIERQTRRYRVAAQARAKARPVEEPASVAPDDGACGNGGVTTPVPATKLARAIGNAAQATGAAVLLILDQFEDHFHYRLEQSSPNRLADEIAACVNAPGLPVQFLIALREDAYGGLGDLFRGRVGNVYKNYIHLEYLTRTEAREAIERPVDVYSDEHPDEEPIALDTGLADAVLREIRRGNLVLGPGPEDPGYSDNSADTTGDEIEAPFLQLVMDRLWRCERKQHSRRLCTHTLEVTLGGAERIVRDHLSDALSDFGAEDLETTKAIFRELVTPSGAKIAHTASDLAKITERSVDSVTSVLSRLDDERIVRAVDPAPGTTTTRYEIFHDKLARPILDWLSVQKADQLRRETEDAKLEADRRRRQARVLLILMGCVTIALAGLIALVFVAEREKNRANAAQRTAESRQLATQAANQFPSDPDAGTLLGLEAYRLAQTPEARSAILTALSKDQPTLVGPTNTVNSVAISPDGTMLAAGSDDNTIRFWSLATHREIGPPIRTGSPVMSVAFSSNGRTLASGNSDHSVRLWSVATREEMGSALTGTKAPVLSVAFSPDGKRLASGAEDDTVRLWSVVTHREIGSPLVAPDVINSVAFSPDGSTLAAGAGDDNVYLWSVGAHHKLWPPLTGHTNEVTSVAFSPDGKTVAAGSWDDKILVWSLATHRVIGTPFIGHSNWVTSVAFSPDGKTLGSGSFDGTVRLWSVSTHTAIGVRLAGNVSNSVAFTPNGATLASGTDDVVDLWNLHSGMPLVRPLSPVSGGTALAASAGGKLIATTTPNGHAIEVSDAHTGREVGIPTTPALSSTIYGLAFSPDGKMVASDSGDRVIRLWSVATDREVGNPFTGYTNSVGTIAFSPDTGIIAAGAPGNMIRLWSTTAHAWAGSALTGDASEISSEAFSPDGKVLASGSKDGSVRLWDVRTREQIGAKMLGAQRAIGAVAFSPDGKTLAAGSNDQTIRLWSVSSQHLVRPPLSTPDAVADIAFSPDGKTLVDVTNRHFLQLWDVQSGESLGPLWALPASNSTPATPTVVFLADGRFVTTNGGLDPTSTLVWSPLMVAHAPAQFTSALCPVVSRNLTLAEWAQAVPDEPYHRTCSK